MGYGRHGGYHLRYGWVRKGLKYFRWETYQEKRLNDAEAAMQIGVGISMFRSVRFWLSAMGLVEPRSRRITPLGEIINKHDPYIENTDTLWLLHYQLVLNVPAWSWFFNVFRHREFDQEQFLHWLSNHIFVRGEKVAFSSIKRDFDCFIRSYEDGGKNAVFSPEDVQYCPFQDLSLLKAIPSSDRSYRLRTVQSEEITDTLFLMAMSQQSQALNRKSLTLEEVERGHNGPGNIFCLVPEQVQDKLLKLSRREHILLKRAAGNNEIRLLKECDEMDFCFFIES